MESKEAQVHLCMWRGECGGEHVEGALCACGGEHVEGSMWRGACGGEHVEGSTLCMWRGACGGEHVEGSTLCMWRGACGGEHVEGSTLCMWRGACGGEHVEGSMWRGACGGEHTVIHVSLKKEKFPTLLRVMKGLKQKTLNLEERKDGLCELVVMNVLFGDMIYVPTLWAVLQCKACIKMVLPPNLQDL